MTNQQQYHQRVKHMARAFIHPSPAPSIAVKRSPTLANQERVAQLLTELKNCLRTVQSLTRENGPIAMAIRGEQLTNPAADAKVWMNKVETDTLVSSLPIHELGLRAKNALSRGRFEHVSELTYQSLSAVRHCGDGTIDEISRWLQRNGHGSIG